MSNQSLYDAKKRKDDEFYTQLVDIEKEMCHYETHFKNKIVYCNCDDYEVSNFWKYFYNNFEKLGLKELVATCYTKGGVGKKAIYDGSSIVVSNLVGDGDFASIECVKLLQRADIVVTNPPFSLFRNFIRQLFDFNKKFIILGCQNALTKKGVFSKVMNDEVWVGYNNGSMSFVVPQDSPSRATRFWVDEEGVKWRSLGNISWFTNIEYEGRYKALELKETFSLEKYPTYDNYRAVEVSKIADIPKDYDGVMGVPITFLTKYNPKQFEIVGVSEECGVGFSYGLYIKGVTNLTYPVVNGVNKFARVFIKHRKPTHK